MIQMNVTKLLLFILPVLALAAGFFLPWFLLLALAVLCAWLIRWFLNGPRGSGVAGGLADIGRAGAVFTISCFLALLLAGKIAGLVAGFDPSAWWLTFIRRLAN